MDFAPTGPAILSVPALLLNPFREITAPYSAEFFEQRPDQQLYRWPDVAEGNSVELGTVFEFLGL